MATCHNRYRTKIDYSHWTIRNWQIASGNFWPRSFAFGKSFYLTDYDEAMRCVNYINKHTGNVVCINDSDVPFEAFNRFKDMINQALHNILPDKSTFEV